MKASDPLLGEKNANSKGTLKTVFMVLGLLSLGCVFLYSSYRNDESTLSLHNEMETFSEAEIVAEIQNEEQEQEQEQDDSFPDPVMYSNEDDETKMSKTEDWHVDQPEPETACGAAYDRGVGTIPDKCKDGDVKEAGMCYNNPCPSGYTTVGASCFEKCPSGYTDVGVTCVTKSAPKPKPQYVRKPSQAGCGPDHRLIAGACYRSSCGSRGGDEYSEVDNIRCATCGGSKWDFFARKTMCEKGDLKKLGLKKVKKGKLKKVKPAKIYLRTPNDPKCPANKPITVSISKVKWCYEKCRPGYKSITGWACQKQCEPGQTNLGAFCQDKDIVKKKDIIVRKPLVPTGCGEKKNQEAGLCYRPCKDGYTGVGPMCFLDLVKFAKLKQDQFAQYFKIFNIYQGGDCFAVKIEELKPKVQALDWKKGLKDASIAKKLMNILKSTFKTGDFSACLKKKLEQWQAAGLWDFRYLAFGIEYAVSAGFVVGGGGSIGIAIAPTYDGGVMDFSPDGIRILAYGGGCVGISLSVASNQSPDIGADYTFVVNRRMDDILGSTYAFGIKATLGPCVGKVSAGPVLGLAPSTCQVTSLGLSIGASVSASCPASVDVGMAWCASEKITATSFAQEENHREAVVFGKKMKISPRIQHIVTEDGPVEIH